MKILLHCFASYFSLSAAKIFFLMVRVESHDFREFFSKWIFEIATSGSSSESFGILSGLR